MRFAERIDHADDRDLQPTSRSRRHQADGSRRTHSRSQVWAHAATVTRLGCASMVAVVLLVAAAAEAQVRPVLLKYQTDRGCPGRDAFMRELRARSSQVSFVEDDPTVLVVTVRVRAEAARFVGDLFAGAHARREVSARSCSELISALALIAALSIDAGTGATDVGVTDAPSAPTSLPLIGAAADASSRHTQSPAPNRDELFAAQTPAPALSPPSMQSVVAKIPRPEPAQKFVGVGLRLMAASAFREDASAFFGGSLSVEGGMRFGSWFVPSLRVSAGYATSVLIAAAVGAAQLSSWTARLDVSLVRLSLGSVAIVPFFAVEGGRIEGKAENKRPIRPLEAQSRLWLALVQGVAIELALTHTIYGSVVLELQEPQRKYRFVFSDAASEITIARTPIVQVAASLGVGMRF